MDKARYLMVLVILLALVVFSGCVAIQPAPAQSDALYQVSLLDALMLGDYDGTVSVGRLRSLGDTGLGTFDQLDGELVMTGGVVYKAKSDGTVDVQPDGETVPFAVSTFFDSDLAPQQLSSLASIDELKNHLDTMISQQTNDFNRFYVALIEGNFALAHVRSVPAQEKPYRPLAEITAEQPEFFYEGLEGTIVALRCPDYMEGINLPGWHLHFISQDRSKGGHVLDVQLTQGVVSMDSIDEFAMQLPGTETFAALELSEDMAAETESAESK